MWTSVDPCLWCDGLVVRLEVGDSGVSLSYGMAGLSFGYDATSWKLDGDDCGVVDAEVEREWARLRQWRRLNRCFIEVDVRLLEASVTGGSLLSDVLLSCEDCVVGL